MTTHRTDNSHVHFVRAPAWLECSRCGETYIPTEEHRDPPLVYLALAKLFVLKHKKCRKPIK